MQVRQPETRRAPVGGGAAAFLPQLASAHPTRVWTHHARQILLLRARYDSTDVDAALAHAARFGALDAASVERILTSRCRPRTLEEYVAEDTAKRIDDVLGPTVTRPTEYTVGTNGPSTMPADLPPTSAYTYAVQLSADEELAAGATELTFSQPLPFYLENFLGFAVGTSVPSGFYDPAQGGWVPSTNGVVLKILSVTAGEADLDINGDGNADTGTALTAIGVTDLERQQLATLYAVGQTLWGVPVPHLSPPWDMNMGAGPPHPSAPPGAPLPFKPDGNGPGGCSQPHSSTIECQRQSLGEDLAIAGTA